MTAYLAMPFDLVPRLVTPDEWRQVERGLYVPRMEALAEKLMGGNGVF